MARLATGMAVVALVLLGRPAEALITLELRVDAALRDAVAVHVGVKNLGDEPAEGALPDVTLLGTTVRGTEPASLPPGFVAAWDLELPRPSALGTLPIVVQLHYSDGFGHPLSAPAVHVLRTAGTPAGEVDLALETTPVAETGTATVRIENREAAAVTGTLHVVASAELGVTPAERPLEIAPGATLTVPVHVENHGALDGSTAALWAYVTLARPTYVDTLAASAAVPVVPPVRNESRARTVLLALAGAAAVGCLLWGARRLLAPAAAPRSRADRRRSGR